MNFVARRWLIGSVFVWSALGTAIPVGFAQSPARDPGVRPFLDWSRIGGLPTTCPFNLLTPLPGLTAAEEKLFCAGAEEFAKEDKVKEDGLTRIMHHASRFCAPAWRAQAVDPSVWIGVRQLAVQRVWD